MSAEPALRDNAPPPPPEPRPAISLKSSEFRRGREASWQELERLTERITRGGVRALSADELQRLPLLYRTTLSSLAVARSIALDRNLLLYLENLGLRAYLAVYGPRVSIWAGAREFLRHGFPAAVRAARWHVLLSAMAMLAGVAIGFFLTVSDEAWFTSFVPAGLAGDRGPSSTRQDLLDGEIFHPAPGALESFALIANFLFTHNTGIGIMTFGLGIAAGIPTLLLLGYQGLILGSFIAIHYDRDLTVEILGWLSVHGITETTALILFGAGGLMIADKVLFPGRYSRLESLAVHGRVAARLAVGAMLMLFVAAILEGCVRQQVPNTELRLAIGGASGLLWFAYFLSGRRAGGAE
jgi:uncharacterized membrane protein SpoIIM required for sporulation